MALPKQKFRELVFQLLFSHDVMNLIEDATLPLMMSQVSASIQDAHRGSDLVKRIVEHKEEIDAVIEKASETYEFDRIQRAELNILRLGVFEILHDDNIPVKVAISEAVRLCRKFSTPESSSFINAVLDSVRIEYEDS